MVVVVITIMTLYAFHSKASTVAQRLPETSEVLKDILDSLKT